jgi:hypothetical protein
MPAVVPHSDEEEESEEEESEEEAEEEESEGEHIEEEPAVMHPPLPDIKPIPVPKLNTQITFGKSSTHILILTKGTVLYKIPYFCQYHVMEEMCKQTLQCFGDERFKQWALEQETLNKKYI